MLGPNTLLKKNTISIKNVHKQQRLTNLETLLIVIALRSTRGCIITRLLQDIVHRELTYSGVEGYLCLVEKTGIACSHGQCGEA